MITRVLKGFITIDVSTISIITGLVIHNKGMDAYVYIHIYIYIKMVCYTS